uniref:Uncharacterized protein n=1 Tax=Parascaris equorum TaxID=6256 RepID=A0A914R606_PAREQ
MVDRRQLATRYAIQVEAAINIDNTVIVKHKIERESVMEHFQFSGSVAEFFLRSRGREFSGYENRVILVFIVILGKSVKEVHFTECVSIQIQRSTTDS